MPDADSAPSGNYGNVLWPVSVPASPRAAHRRLAVGHHHAGVARRHAPALERRAGLGGQVDRAGVPAAGLPGEAALPFLTGALLNIYSALAAMAPLALDGRQITILAIMLLISHNLPVEVSVQRRAGSSWLRILVLRLVMSLVAAFALNLILPGAGGTVHAQAAVGLGASGLPKVLRHWLADAAWLIGKIVVIVIGLMILQNVLKEFGVMRWLAQVLRPVLWLLGLPQRTASSGSSRTHSGSRSAPP